MNEKLLHSDIQLFINKNLKKDNAKLLLKGSPFTGISIQDIVEQIISKNKCQKKLPTWFETNPIYYPNKLNIEQTSSELTAQFKSELISGDKIVDITGGFGVDDFYFSKRFKNVIHCEWNDELSTIAKHNFKALAVKNVECISTNGLDYLKNSKQNFDWIYADPSRRNDSKGKVFLLEDCLPNIPENLKLLFQKSKGILLKLSPILDIKATIQALDDVKEIIVLAVDNEVKETLFLLQKNYSKGISIQAVNIKNSSNKVFKAIYGSNKNASYALPKKYLYEPNVAILKAGLFNEVSFQLKINKLHINSHLYTSNELIDFPGRRFVIQAVGKVDKKDIKKLLPLLKANITTRNFPLNVAQIRKKFSIKDGGENYLFFTTNKCDKKIILYCKKI